MESKTDSNGKVKIYLADLVHNYVGRGPFMFPINIGYVKSYLQKFHSDNLDVRLFKYPNKLIEAVENEPPNMVAFSNYTWNEDLDAKLIYHFKNRFPNIVTAIGGPNVNIHPRNVHEELENIDPRSLTNFLRNQPNLDFYVLLKGEFGFLNLVNSYLQNDHDIKKMKSSPIDGLAFINNKLSLDKIIRGKDPPLWRNLDEVPSPYLTGVMDEFFLQKLIPNLETDRGCPYPCTFCDWGQALYQKMEVFPKDRVMNELEYIVDMVNKTKNTKILCIPNANFGIMEQDLDYARKIRELSDKHGYPRKVTTFWAKNKSKRIIEMAEILGGDLVSVDASLQSMNPKTLEAVKRDNISQEDYLEFLKYLNKNGIDSDAELIYGLPEETRESYLGALRKLFDMRAGMMLNYHCRVLNGSEMSEPDNLEKYGTKTKFRLIDIQFGEYSLDSKPFKAFEVEEMVKSNNTMSEEDIFYFRKLHWLVNFTWNYKYYRGLLEYGLSHHVNPIDFYNTFTENLSKAPKRIVKLVKEFDEESKSEWFLTREELVEHYSKPENFKDIQNGSFDKLHFKYGFKTLLECPDEFDFYMGQVAKDLISRKDVKVDYKKAVDELIKFENMFRISFKNLDISKEFEVETEKFGEFGYDILRWKQNAYEGSLHDHDMKQNVKYRFYLPQNQVDSLKTYINQFKNINPLFTLRKMSEYMGVSDLFYRVESKDIKAYKMQVENHMLHTSKLAQ